MKISSGAYHASADFGSLGIFVLADFLQIIFDFNLGFKIANWL